MQDSEGGTDSNETAPLLPARLRENSASATSLRTPWDPRRGKIAGGLVLAVLTLERLAFYAVLSNLYVFLTTGPNAWPSEDAISATLLMVGLAYFSALPAGWIADALVRKRKNIEKSIFFERENTKSNHSTSL